MEKIFGRHNLQGISLAAGEITRRSLVRRVVILFNYFLI